MSTHTHTHLNTCLPEHTCTSGLEPGVFQVSEVDGRNSIVGREQRPEEEEEEEDGGRYKHKQNVLISRLIDFCVDKEMHCC